ncbi:hypothetical protein F2P45_10330 [Massilia sp. CCM 8733]|uniref:Uncharacterized protein n=1 Tax=Massilia mucilaginosa TaxID=2609282 RepID=A0ABX0NRB6_9BURK|nr:hypothetical protein [Massilia mucilaginosa]NHZ89409.1 hypothetical protein [Massilia mucilaginosa]
MIMLKIAVLLAASLAAGDAVAHKDGVPAAPDAPAKHARARPEPAKPVPPKKPPPKRRAVQQIVDGMPAYGPRLSAQPALPVSPQPAPSMAVPAPIAPPPAVISRCDAGGCTDVNGTRYNGAAGNSVIGPQGRSCTNNGGVIQCF